MAAIKATFNGVIIDLYGRVISGPVKIVGELMYSDRGVGGGPLPGGPGDGGGGGDPPGIWGGPIDPYPDHGLPVPQPPIKPPEGPADDNGFIKPPPAEGGWAYHQTYGWMYDPPAGAAQPKS